MIKSGTEIIGDIKCTGDIRIDGMLRGSLHTEGRLVVGDSGKIEGNISCKNGDLSGTIRAKVIVHELLSLKAACNLEGEISTNKLHIEPGANFTGNCQMGGVVKGIESNEKAQQAL